MNPCKYIELQYHRPLPSVACTATLCALPADHGGLHVMQSARELRKWTWREDESLGRCRVFLCEGDAALSFDCCPDAVFCASCFDYLGFEPGYEGPCGRCLRKVPA